MSHDGITHPGKRAMVKALAVSGRVTEAAKAAGIARCSHYEWLSDPDYAKAVEDAMVAAVGSGRPRHSAGPWRASRSL